MKVLQAALCLVVIGLSLNRSHCNACINDIELPQHEREFRSQYEVPNSSSLMTQSQADAPNIALISGSGWLLLGVATVLTVIKPRDRSL